jgi:prepilin peptidase CpaA
VNPAVEGEAVVEILRWAFLGGVVVAALTDLRALRIPNALVLACLGLALLRLALEPALLGPHLAVGGIAFALTLALFARNLMGGGDAKLLPVVALWLGPQAILDFLVLLAVLAGGIALMLVLARLGLAAVDGARERWPLVLRRGEGLPLAAAIAPAAALLL